MRRLLIVLTAAAALAGCSRTELPPGTQPLRVVGVAITAA
ncbi:lipoprotein [uncultured Pseudacidovorax sp.]|nr:lipoprotein [uncultured Pseudacidovorax sp.]